MGQRKKKKKGPTPKAKEQGIRFVIANQTFGGPYNLPRLEAQLKWEDEVLGKLEVFAVLGADMGDHDRIDVNTVWTDHQDGAEEAQREKVMVIQEMKATLERIALADAAGPAGELSLRTLEKCGLVTPKPIEEMAESS